MRIVFFGTPDFAVPTLSTLLAHPAHVVLGVVTQPDKRRGRGNDLIPSPVKQLALEHQLPVWQPSRIKRDDSVIAALQALDADVFVVVAYGQILSTEILEIPRWGCINNHASLLPKYRGAAPIQWAIYHGETETGITTMQMDAGMDTGAMLLRATTEVNFWENAAELGQRLAGLGADLLLETLAKLEAGQLTPMPQEQTQATYAPLIQKSDYHLDWHRSALAIHHQVRGFYPHVQTSIQGTAVKILMTMPLLPGLEAELPPALHPWISEAPSETVAGEIIGLVKGLGPIVETGQGRLLIQDLQPAGKKRQSGWDFANGMRLTVGMIWGLEN